MKTIETLDQIIFFVKPAGIIEEDTLRTVIQDYFRDETTSPKGCEPRVHVRKETHYITEDGEEFRHEQEAVTHSDDWEWNDINKVPRWELWTWGVGGNNPKYYETFKTEEEAEEALWQEWIHNYEVDDGSGLNDCLPFFFSLKDAEEFIKETYTED